jgi:sugar lactone lactonase YvrE
MKLTVHTVPAEGAEDVVVAPDGTVYTGTEDGQIFRVSHDGSKVESIGHTGGRPLGLELDGDGRLLVCDSKTGLLRLDPKTGDIEPITDRVAGTKMMFCNNAAIAGDGTVYFSDSSTQYGIEDWMKDFVEHTRTGRLLRLDPDGSITVLETGLAFANGVALAADESFVAVAETRARTVVRHWLTGERAGQRDFLVEDLPGYPDNISRGSDGLIWVTISSPTNPVAELLGKGPLGLRKAATRIPERLQPKPKRTIRVQAFDNAGVLVHDLDVKDERYHLVTGVREYDGRVWLGSLHEPAVAVIDL